jgi:hypothetical protein
MASARMSPYLGAAAPLLVAGAFLTAVLGSDLERRRCPAVLEAAPQETRPAPKKPRDATYAPWELVSV